MEVTFQEEHGRTRMTIVQRGFPTAERRDEFADGWPSILDGLGRVVSARVAGLRVVRSTPASNRIRVRRATRRDRRIVHERSHHSARAAGMGGGPMHPSSSAVEASDT
jgi:hypothetical protein